MRNMLENHEIEITCNNCKRKTKKSIGWIKSHTEFNCTCGTHITLDTLQFRSDIAKVERSLADLENSFKKFGK